MTSPEKHIPTDLISNEDIQKFSQAFSDALPDIFPDANIFLKKFISQAQNPFSLPPSFFSETESAEAVMEALKGRQNDFSQAIFDCLSKKIHLGKIPLFNLQRDASWEDMKLQFRPSRILQERIYYIIRLSIEAEGSGGYVIDTGSEWIDPHVD